MHTSTNCSRQDDFHGGMRMKCAIMQPYFLPYIGYFQLMDAVDVFIIYDNIKYTKKGWINRNRYLLNSSEAVFTVPLVKGSDELQVVERTISDSFDRRRFLDRLREAYRGAPYLNETMELLAAIVNNDETNLFRFIHQSVMRICRVLAITTEVVVSSTIPVDHTLKAEDKVLAICKAMNAGVYINAIGGVELYSKERFASEGIALKFIKSAPVEYPQFGNSFVPWLSIVDLLMFNPTADIQALLKNVSYV